jgi:hypothetical protein
MFAKHNDPSSVAYYSNISAIQHEWRLSKARTLSFEEVTDTKVVQEWKATDPLKRSCFLCNASREAASLVALIHGYKVTYVAACGNCARGVVVDCVMWTFLVHSHSDAHRAPRFVTGHYVDDHIDKTREYCNNVLGITDCKKAEAERKANAEADARKKAEAERKANAEADARKKAEAERKANAEADARKKAEAECKANAEADARKKAEAERKAEVVCTVDAVAQPLSLPTGLRLHEKIAILEQNAGISNTTNTIMAERVSRVADQLGVTLTKTLLVDRVNECLQQLNL